MIKIFLSIILLIPIITFAKDNPINNFIIGFWPEYDHPGVLVSIQIESDSTQLPYNFNLIVPNTTRMAIESYVEENELISNQVEVINNTLTNLTVGISFVTSNGIIEGN